jgi:acyl-CoA thioesterase I
LGNQVMAKHPALFVKSFLDRLKGKPKPITPGEYLRRGLPRPQQVVVMLGDSLTEGLLSANFVVPLQEELRVEGYHFINAGVSADLVYNLLQRTGEVIACRPDGIVILAGANDAQASASRRMGEMFVKMKQLPQLPSEAWFCENLHALASCLKTALPGCRIALMSLGTYGEDLTSPANLEMARFSQRICDIAAAEGLDYLPLHERFSTYLSGKPYLRRLDFDDGRMMRMMYRAAVLQRSILRQSFDQVGASNRFHLLSDGLHFNERGARMVVELVRRWLA